MLFVVVVFGLVVICFDYMLVGVDDKFLFFGEVKLGVIGFEVLLLFILKWVEVVGIVLL